MAFRLKISIYPITLLLLVLFYGCHSLPPSEPLAEEKGFDPRILPWEKVSLPQNLLGDWYGEGKIDLTVGEDTLLVRGVWTLIQSAAKSDSYYRIIYKIGGQYHTIYFRDLTKEEVKMVCADGNAADEEGASALPVVSSWSTLTSTNPWIPTGMPGEMPGNWHIHDGKLEMVIDREGVILDGELWEIDSVQTNRTVDRLILRSGEIYKSFYFQEVERYTMEALLVDGKEDIQDRYGKVYGEWSTLYRWWDFIEKCSLYPGSRWVYDYSYSESYIKVYNTSSPIDSIIQTNSFKGQFELEVTSTTIQDGTGSLTLQTAFLIYGGEGSYRHFQKDSVIRKLTDSSWVNPGILKTEQYEIVLENDTLWYEAEEGKVLFASAKIESHAAINLRAFVYPFEFPREGFPEGRDIFVDILFHDESIPSSLQGYGYELHASIISSGKRTYVFGLYMNNYVCLLFGGGFSDMNYFHGDYNQRYWYGGPQYLDPYVKETSFSCKLVSFSPGY